MQINRFLRISIIKEPAVEKPALYYSVGFRVNNELVKPVFFYPTPKSEVDVLVLIHLGVN
jgi:hypothetical protein